MGLCNILPSAFCNLKDLLNYSLRNVQGLSIAVTSFLLVSLDTGFELLYLPFVPQYLAIKSLTKYAFFPHIFV